jgi:hypothetical protein
VPASGLEPTPIPGAGASMVTSTVSQPPVTVVQQRPVSAAVSQHENNAGPRLIADGILRMLFIAGGGMLDLGTAL